MPNFFGESFNQTTFAALMARLLVVVTLVFGTTISQAQTPPFIVGQPQNQLVLTGSNAVFSVGATGNNPAYHWYFNGTSIASAISQTLILTNVQATQAGNYSVSVSNASGSVTSSNAILTVLTVTINPYPAGTLGYDLFEGTCEKAGLTNSRTASYNPNASNLGSNTAVWTWPANLSCVGYASDGFQTVLITSNALLSCGHFGGEMGQTVTFHDTNGVPWVAVVTNTIHPIADLVIAQLSSAAPPSIVIPYVLPPNYANYIAGHTLLGMPAFWLHKNPGHIDYAPIADIGDYGWYGYGTWIRLNHANNGFSGSSATGGDSGSPAFLSWKNCPVLMFATTLAGDACGLFVSGMTNWNSLAALGLTNGMKVIDVSGYPLWTGNGTNTFTLTVSGAGTNYISVFYRSAVPVAGFAGKPINGFAPLQVVFSDASSGNITNWLWNFGDGNSITNNNKGNVTHTYSAAGNYMVTLTVGGPGGTNTVTQTNYVSVSPLPAAPVAGFTGTPVSGLAPLPVVFSDSSTGSITNWLWDFGDGNSITNNNNGNVTHTFAAAGNYAVTLTVSGAGGMNTATQINYVNVSSVPVAPTPGFTGTPTNGNAPLQVVFSDASIGSITNWIWNFGDGNSVTNNNNGSVTNTYANVGNYTVTLTVSGPGGASTETQTSSVSVTTSSAAPGTGFTGIRTGGLAPLQQMSSSANITLNTPASQLNVSAGSVFNFTWQTTDLTPAATINLYLDINNNPASGLIPIVSGLPNQMGSILNTSYVWQASATLAGTNYYVYATMTDGSSSASSFAPGQLQIDSVGTFQLLSSIEATNATYVYAYAYYGVTYTGTNQLVLGANVISVTNGTAIHQFIVTRVPSLAQVEAVQYNPLNQVTTITNGNGIVTTMTYDPLGRLVQRQSSNGALVTYGYDVLSRRTNMVDYTGTTFYGYDGLNRFTNVTTSASGVFGGGDNLVLSYEYDLAGQETAIVYPGGERIQYSYDSGGRIKTVNNVTRTLLFQYYYNPTNSLLNKLSRPNGIETDYAYDSMGRLTNILHQVSSTSALVAQYGYTLDAIGKTTLLTTTLPGSVALEQYGYDYFDRLTNVVYGNNGVIDANSLSVSYTYDGNGNRLTMTTKTNNVVTEIRTYNYGAENRLLNVINQNGLLLDTYTYDPAGNRIEKVATNYTAFYTYDERNLMTTYADQTNAFAYAYNGDAQRVSTTENGALTRYVTDPNRSLFQVVQERNGSGALTASYTFGGTRLATWNGGAVTYELDDRLGSIRLVTDAAGNVVQSYNYDAFGGKK